MKVSDLVRRVDELIVSGKQVQATRYREGDDYIYNHYVSDGLMTGFRSACLSFIERVFGKDHSHYEQFTTKQVITFMTTQNVQLPFLKRFAVNYKEDGSFKSKA
jgi:hypothetical protein